MRSIASSHVRAAPEAAGRVGGALDRLLSVSVTTPHPSLTGAFRPPGTRLVGQRPGDGANA
jgi:hypothetical protein